MLSYKRLLSEDGKNLSLGRLSYWILLGLAIYFWVKNSSLPQHLFDMLIYLLVYNLGKKTIRTLNTYFENKAISKTLDNNE